MSEAGKRRITYKNTRPNPLFEEWLKELYEEARQSGSKLEPMLKEALESLSKYPLRLESGAECAILKGFKKKLCVFLDMRLDVYKSNLNLEADCVASSGSQLTNSSDVDIIKDPSPEKIRKKERIPSTVKEANVFLPKKSGCYPSQLSSNSNVTSTSNRHNSNLTEKKINNGTHSELHANDKALQMTNAESTLPSTSFSQYDKSHKTEFTSQNSTRSKKECKTYKPKFRSGGFAILVALLEQLKNNPNVKALTKDELIDKAQIYSNESFTRPKPDSFYTAWANMNRLLEKGLVIKKYDNKKKEYSLSNDGFLLAKKLYRELENRPSDNDVIFDNVKELVSTEADNGTNSPDIEVITIDEDSNKVLIEMPAGSFDVILLIDKNETGGVTKKNDPTVAQFKKYPDLKHEYRSLKVGDFTWIARHKVNKDQELVLPYIIERKRMDDLGASIKDGRFHEQKFRLKKCGLDNVIYMVEHYGSNKHVGLPIQSLKQALANTRVQDQFRVHETHSLTDSARFLAIMTKRLTIEFKDKTLRGGNCEPSGDNLMTFDFFNKSSMKSKRLTVRETFIKMLLQLKGVSVEKALAITNKYNTPRSLIEEYKMCNETDGQLLLANLRFGDLNRNVGPNLSKAIYHLFSL